MTNAECIAELSDRELEHQISEACADLRGLDRDTDVFDAAAADLRELLDERRARKARA